MKTQATRYRKLSEVLGEGSYKTVTKAIDEEEGKEVAYNEVKIRRYEEETQAPSSFSKEIALLKNIDHPYIIKIFDYWFTDEDFVFITELMTGGTLRDYVMKVGPLNRKLIRKWGRQVLEGLKYLHTCDPPIIHRDIKNENIFVNASQGEIKIGDLGIAKEKKHKRYTIVGTPNFMAREMFEGEGYSEKVDIYAFGMALIEMATGKTPYAELSDSSEVCRCVLKGVLPGSLGAVRDNCLRSLIMSCLVPQSNRCSAAQCLEHHFFYPEASCSGDCIPSECVTVFPLSDPVRGMELSLVSFNDPVITFQILLTETSRFIKFDYHLIEDSLEKVSAELINESIISSDSIEAFVELLEKGIRRVLEKNEAGQIRSGIITLGPEDPTRASSTAANCAMAAPAGGVPIAPIEVLLDPFKKVEFGEKTLEVMNEIEQEMYVLEQKKAVERLREEEIAARLRQRRAEDTNTECAGSTGSSSLSDTAGQGSAHSSGALSNPLPNSHLTNGQNATVQASSSNAGVSTSLSSPQAAVGLSASTSPAGSALKLASMSIADVPGREGTLVSPSAPVASSPGSISSPPAFIPTRAPEDTAFEDLGLSEGYDACRTKYRTNYSVAQFAADVAIITGRTEDTAKSWTKSLRDEDIETVFDLKLIVYEDWERLPLTVFSCRAMQNMLYGIDGIPMKEKQLPMNPALADYDNKLSIKAFLLDVCAKIDRLGIATNWENTLMAQDVRTVAELKSLHTDDWGRLGLSVFAYRILKNVIFRKGKISLEYE